MSSMENNVKIFSNLYKLKQNFLASERSVFNFIFNVALISQPIGLVLISVLSSVIIPVTVMGVITGGGILVEIVYI